MATLYRWADLSDMRAVHDGLRLMEQRAATYPFVVTTSLRKAAVSIEHAIITHNAYVIDGYLVLTDVIKPWYSEDAILQEWYVMRLYKGGTVASIPPALKQIAKDLGCAIIMTADSSPVQIVAAAYEAAGFTKLTQSYCTKA